MLDLINLKQPKSFYIEQINLMCEPLKRFDEKARRNHARELTESFDDYFTKINHEIFEFVELYRICKKAIGVK